MLNRSLVSNWSSLLRNQIRFDCSYRLYCKKIEKKVKNHCIVSTVGAQSSGKSTLTECLRKVSSEDFHFKLDPIINSGTNNAVYSRYLVDDTQIVHIDVDSTPPKNLMTSNYATDIGIVVVDSSKGLTNETKEHIIFLEFHGIKQYIVYLNKSDLNEDEELRELITDEIKSFFKQRNLTLEDDSIVYGSALNVLKQSDGKSEENKDRDSIQRVLNLIEMKSKKLPREEQLKKPALFSIKRSHTKLNKGTEVTGYMRQGQLKKGDIVNVCGYDRMFKTKIQEIESFNEPLDSVEPGVSAALQLKSIKREDIQRGMVVIHPDNKTIEITDHFKASLYLFKKEELSNSFKNLTDDLTFQIFARTFDVRTIVKLDGDQKQVVPGEKGLATFKVRRC